MTVSASSVCEKEGIQGKKPPFSHTLGGEPVLSHAWPHTLEGEPVLGRLSRHTLDGETVLGPVVHLRWLEERAS